MQYPLIKNQWLELYDRLEKYKIHFSRKQNQLYSALERHALIARPTPCGSWMTSSAMNQ